MQRYGSQLDIKIYVNITKALSQAGRRGSSAEAALTCASPSEMHMHKDIALVTSRCRAIVEVA